MATDEEFCERYLLVNAKEASLYDLACILICSTSFLNTKNFYDEQSEYVGRSTRGNIRRRFVIFASILAQKVFIWAEKPVTLIGALIELWLNLLSSNGGFFGLLINYIRGKVVMPEESPEKFVSIVGELDNRLKLDESSRKGDGRYNPSLAIMAAKLSYENEAFVKAAIQDQLKMAFIGFYKFWNDYQNQFTTYATMFQDTLDPNLIVVAFRGTNPFNVKDWMTDVDISWYELKDMNDSKTIGRIHGGFMKALGLQKIKGWPKELEPPPNATEEHPFAYYKIKEKLKEILEMNTNAKFILTGHSLGGSLAILFMGVLGLHEETWLLKKLEGVYTFGQPRVGDESFGRYMMKIIKDHDVKYFRYVYGNDIVPRLPFDDKSLFFKHFGTTLYFNSFYGGKVMEEEPNKNYFSMVWAIPKYINAFWEIIRSFILPYWKGKEYKETHVERLFRMVGMIIPGLAAHSPKDYVDVTRLGTELVPTINE
ncbi:putative triacylglycerol lipase [Helianthus annuus]|nr:putative triacylglycerol lipase [Helianthus annuus]